MRHEKYYHIWSEFMTQNTVHFLNYTEKWLLKLEKVKEFIKLNDKLPSRYNTKEEIT
jgi:hypothetical protein